MSSLESALVAINAKLTHLHVEFALVGGLAVSVRTEPRFTRDADIAVALLTDRDAEVLIHALRSHGFLIATVIEQEAVGRLATVRLGFSSDPKSPVVDLLFASSGIESEIVGEANELELLPGLTMRVARIGHLIAMKVLSRDDLRRPQDVLDLRNLIRASDENELAKAREALSLIARRGYHRGRDLPAEMDRLFS